ncbi:MAG: GNAT family N-acetyltransferase [Propionibacteriaceae bacterium]
MPVTIREAAIADVEAIAGLKTKLVATWFDDPSYLAQAPDYPEQLRARISELVVLPTHYYLVAYDGVAPVACMSASVHKALPGPDWSGVSAYLGDLYVEADYRGQYLATQMMDLCLAWCREQHAYRASMHSTRMALAMYEKQGWVRPRLEEEGGPFQSLDYYFADHAG